MSDILVLVTSRGLCQVAALAWFFYDYLLSLEDEVDHIWLRKFNITTLFYISSRVLSFVMLVIGAVQATRIYPLSPAQCEIFHWVEGVGTMMIFVNTQLVLQYRLWAIYNRSSKILLVNGVFFLLESAASIIVCGFFYAKQQTADIPTHMSGVGGETCTTVPQREMALVFLSVVVYEAWLVGLALFRTIQTRRLLSVTGHRTLTEVVAFDSVMYFGLILASVVAVIFVWLFAPLYPGNAAIAFTRAASGLGASRLILHMRSEARARDAHSFSQGPECVGVSLIFTGPCAEVPQLVPSRTRPSLPSTKSAGSSPRPSIATSAGGGYSPRPSVASSSSSGSSSRSGSTSASSSRSLLRGHAHSPSRPSLSGSSPLAHERERLTAYDLLRLPPPV